MRDHSIRFGENSIRIDHMIYQASVIIRSYDVTMILSYDEER